MKKLSILIYFFCFSLILGCSKTEPDCGCEPPPVTPMINKVLVLVVDYTTYTFQGGKELIFQPSNTFTIQKTYQSPGDFGWIKFTYQEVNSPLFEGRIVWNGLGTILFPTTINPASSFNRITTAPTPIPAVGFDNIDNTNNTNNTNIDYTRVWDSIKYLELVNQFVALNSRDSLKILLYTPSVGVANPADWKYIIFVKN